MAVEGVGEWLVDDLAWWEGGRWTRKWGRPPHPNKINLGNEFLVIVRSNHNLLREISHSVEKI
jgi:hypothetical protein